MKKILPFLSLFALGQLSYAQCTLSGLSSFYCASDTNGYTLTPSGCGSNATLVGTGISNGLFYPSLAGTGTVSVYVQSGTSTTYTVTQTGTSGIGSGGFSMESTSGATSVSLGDDQVSGSLSIGFTFSFFGTDYTNFYISSNGWITFTSTTNSLCCSGGYLPSSSYPSMIAASWSDLYPPGGGSITYKTIGTAPNRILTVTFTSIPQCCGTSYPRTHQYKLFEGCGLIEIHTASQPYPGTVTQGIQNASGNAAYYVSGRNQGVWTATNDYVLFTPNCGTEFTTTVSGGADLDIPSDTIDCYGGTDGTLTVTATGSNPFTYAWSTSSTSTTISSLSPGTYTVSVTDNDGCESVGEGIVESPDPIGASVNTENSSCEGGDDGYGEIYASGGTAPYAYMWSNSSSNNIQTGLAPGTYTITVTDAHNCTAEFGATVGFDNPDPDINLGNDRTICPGQQIVLVAPSGYSAYAWNTLATTTSIVVSAAGTYSLTATSAAGCFGWDSIEVTEVTPVYVDLGPTNQAGLAPIYLSAGPNFVSYLWNTGADTSTIAVTIPGQYRITVIDSNGCVTKDTVNVKIWPVGINEISENGITVYPNPANDFITIRSGETSGISDLVIFTMSGSLVMEKKVELIADQEAKIDISTLPIGNYLVRIQNDKFAENRIISVE